MLWDHHFLEVEDSVAKYGEGVISEFEFDFDVTGSQAMVRPEDRETSVDRDFDE